MKINGVQIQDRRQGIIGVGLQTPPKTVYSKFHPGGVSPLEQLHDQSFQPHLPQSANLSSVLASQNTASTSQNPGPIHQNPVVGSISSISDGDHRLVSPRYCGTFQDFLTFAGISPCDEET